MKKSSRAQLLFQKYLDRTASSEELQEMFKIFEDKQEFDSVLHLFEKEWESKDVTFDIEDLTLEQIRMKVENGKKSRHPRSGLKIGTWRYRWITGAAATGLILMSVSIWYFTRCMDLTYSTGYGETKEIVLDDNTSVRLNANSQLVWKSDWCKTGERLVYLEGEAFFEVNKIKSDEYDELAASGENMPFRVVTPDLTIKVYGTAFNVESRRDKTDVFLESGSVELELNHRLEDQKSMIKDPVDTNLTSTTNTIRMKPGDAVSYSAYNHYLEHVNNSTTQENASWVEGSLSFENESLKDVLNSLEDIYGKKFQVDDAGLLKRKVNLGLPYEDWETVFGLMTLSLEVKMKEENGVIKLDRKKGN